MTSKMTLPWTDETATMSTLAVLLFGVKTTLNRLAVKLEFSWHVFNDLDWRMGSAATRLARLARAASGDSRENLMMWFWRCVWGISKSLSFPDGIRFGGRGRAALAW